MRTHRFAALGISLSVAVLSTSPALPRDLSFDERVQAQEAIERVYYSHQIGATKLFEDAIPPAVLERNVRDYLRQSVALEQFWNTPITAGALRRELERIVENTRFPDRLREIYEALGGDEFLFLECYVRPSLVDRLSRNFFSSDERVHSDAKMAAEQLQNDLLSGKINVLDGHPYRTLIDGAAVEGPVTAGDAPTGDVSGKMLRVKMIPDEFDRQRALAPPGVGEIGDVSEERDAFLIRVILAEESEGARMAVYVVRKRTWDDWWDSFREQIDETLAAGGATDLSETISPETLSFLENTGSPTVASPCDQPDDVWQNRILGVPDGRETSVVWTGSHMILWGGHDDRTYFGDGWRYDPVSDTWTPISRTGSPAARYLHAAVWTGTLMVVWGGYDGSQDLDTGGRYDPASDTWMPMSTTDAPHARTAQGTAVWTGTQMIIWGGGASSAPSNDGGRYDPVSDTWTPTSRFSAPAPRRRHSIIWTGSTVVVWGGTSLSSALISGGRYDPVTDSWTPTSTIGAPSMRSGQSAVWTGNLMLVWGGLRSVYLVTGARYNPSSDSWTPMSTIGAPPGRTAHSAIWTGNEMIVWGGRTSGSTYLNNGGRYDPIMNAWSPVSSTNAPAARVNHSSVWTGSLMIVWGGFRETGLRPSTGGRYDPLSDTWTPTAPNMAPQGRREHSAVWTGSYMIVWGGYPHIAPYELDDGWVYDPVSDTWTPTSTAGAPTPRYYHTAVWTGDLMVVWGGGFYLDTGGRYEPISDTWMPTSTIGAPAGRRYHSAIWTGDAMIVWGGRVGSAYVNSGGRYNPLDDSWTPTSDVSAPVGRALHKAVWTGARMVVWGGAAGDHYLDTGGLYDPKDDTWAPTSMVNAPSKRIGHTGIWTGSRMVVWGGVEELSIFNTVLTNTGAEYDPYLDTWVTLSTLNAPAVRSSHTTVWTGSLMIVWGGNGGSAGYINTGGRYDPISDIWRSSSTVDAPLGRALHTAVWTGSEMIVFGGITARSSGGLYAVTDQSDRDEDGFRFCDGDCDDGNLNTYPGAVETCDGVDENCDGLIDEDFDVGASCQVIVDECHRVDGVWSCRPDGTDTRCEGVTQIYDTTSPTLTVMSAPAALWPPNHKMVTVDVDLRVEDLCDQQPAVTLISASSSEPDEASGMGDGSTVGDIAGADFGTPDNHVNLRAERDGAGPGRVYELAYLATDASGNATPAFATVIVPHDQGSGPEPLIMRLEPGGIHGMTRIYWSGMQGAIGYDLIAGDLAQAKVENSQLSLGSVKVLARGTTATSLIEGAEEYTPPLGAAVFYLIQPRGERDGMGYGTESAPWPRVPAFCEGGCP